MDNPTATDLQGQSVAKITEQLTTLDRATLVELQALETAAEAPRTTLLAAIDAQLKALDDAGEGGDQGGDTAVDGGEGKPAAKAAVKDDAPAAKAAVKLTKSDWQHPDYAGPLNGEQASWRVRNVKPAKAVVTK